MLNKENSLHFEGHINRWNKFMVRAIDSLCIHDIEFRHHIKIITGTDVSDLRFQMNKKGISIHPKNSDQIIISDIEPMCIRLRSYKYITKLYLLNTIFLNNASFMDKDRRRQFIKNNYKKETDLGAAMAYAIMMDILNHTDIITNEDCDKLSFISKDKIDVKYAKDLWARMDNSILSE